MWLNILIHQDFLKSCSHSGTSCNSSLRNSSSSSFLLVFPVSADPRDGFPRTSSLKKSHFFLLLDFPCDEDVEEAGEDEVEENSSTGQGQRMVHSSLYCH